MTDRIEVLTHSSIRIRSSVGTLYIDPFRVEGEPHDADYILITHDHYDHFSPEDVAKICKEGSVMVVPETMKAKAQEESASGLTIYTVHPGQICSIGELELETVPAYNRLKPFHPKSAGWVGYILKVDDSRVYIAGDTDVTEEAKKVRCDIALVPVGGTYTMNAVQAAGLINKIHPAVAIPTHYGSVVGKKEDADAFAEKVDHSISVEIKMLS